MAKISWKRAAEALDAVRPDLTTAARQMLLGQAHAETEFGKEMPDGSNTNNWGSIGGAGDLGTYEITDTIEGKPIVRKVAWFSTPEKGAEAFAKVVLERFNASKPASVGDAWGYARALWRDGPNQPELGAPSKAPAYYTGFPPGDKRGLAPADVKPRSKLDDWYRVTAYSTFVLRSAKAAATALGEPLEVKIVEPPKPDEDSTDPLPLTAMSGAKPKPKPEPEKMSPEALAEYEARKAEEERILAAEREEQEAGVKRDQAEIARKEAEAEKAKAEEAKKLAAKGGTKTTEQAIPTGAIVVGVLGLAWLLFGRK